MLLSYGFPPDAWEEGWAQPQRPSAQPRARPSPQYPRRQPDMQRSADELGQSYMGQTPPSTGSREAQEVVETPESYYVFMDVPGYSKSDVNIQLEDRILAVSGRKKQDPRRRTGTNQLSKFWVVPEDVKLSDITARVENGELTVELPRLKVHPRSFRVPVLGGSESKTVKPSLASHTATAAANKPVGTSAADNAQSAPASQRVAKAPAEEPAAQKPEPQLTREDKDGSVEAVPDDEEGSVPATKRLAKQPLKDGPVLMRVASSAVDAA